MNATTSSPKTTTSPTAIPRLPLFVSLVGDRLVAFVESSSIKFQSWTTDHQIPEPYVHREKEPELLEMCRNSEGEREGLSGSKSIHKKEKKFRGPYKMFTFIGY